MNRSAAWALTVLLVINTMNFFDRQILGAVAEPVRQEFQLDDTKLGTLGTAFTLLYAVVGLPLGRLADKSSRTRILSAGVTLWSLLTAASGMVQSVWQLFVVRLGVGVGEATCAPAATSLIADLFPSGTRGRAMSVFMLGLPIGIGLSFLVSATISAWFGWRAAFFIAGIPGLICAILVLYLREPARGASEDPATRVPHKGGSPFLVVMSIPTVWWLIVSGALHNFNMYALGAFLAAMLQRYHGLGIVEAGIIAMVAYGLSGVPGLLLGGWGADILRARRVDGRLLVGAGAILLAAPLTYGALVAEKGNTAQLTLLLSVGCALMYVYYASVYPTLQDVVLPEMRATAMALYFFAMYVAGASMGPWVVGTASDYFAITSAASAGITHLPVAELPLEHRAEGLRGALMTVPVLNIILAAVLFAGCFTVRKDAQRVRREVPSKND